MHVFRGSTDAENCAPMSRPTDVGLVEENLCERVGDARLSTYDLLKSPLPPQTLSAINEVKLIV